MRSRLYIVRQSDHTEKSSTTFRRYLGIDDDKDKDTSVSGFPGLDLGTADNVVCGSVRKLPHCERLHDSPCAVYDPREILLGLLLSVVPNGGGTEVTRWVISSRVYMYPCLARPVARGTGREEDKVA